MKYQSIHHYLQRRILLYINTNQKTRFYSKNCNMKCKMTNLLYNRYILCHNRCTVIVQQFNRINNKNPLQLININPNTNSYRLTIYDFAMICSLDRLYQSLNTLNKFNHML